MILYIRKKSKWHPNVLGLKNTRSVKMKHEECQCQICTDFHQDLIDEFVSLTFDEMIEFAFCTCNYGTGNSCLVCYRVDTCEDFDEIFPYNPEEQE